MNAEVIIDGEGYGRLCECGVLVDTGEVYVVQPNHRELMHVQCASVELRGGRGANVELESVSVDVSVNGTSYHLY